jgi:tRNA U34 5-methylaminomethyl-2-thiouridine-forming methyltransferase MnmC
MSPRPDRPRIATSSSGWRQVVTDDGSRTLECPRTGQTHHSESGALAESRHVYLENSLASERLRRGEPVRVFETGFGVGLNFWLTASLALRHRANLAYVSIEQHLPPANVIADLQFAALEVCQPAVDRFLPLFMPPGAPTGSLVLSSDEVTLQVLCVDATQQDLAAWGTFDAVYHDPFSPEVNPELWSADYLARLAGILTPGGRLVTYCCRSEIKQRLRAAGLTVVPTRGPPGGKREVLVAVRPLEQISRINQISGIGLS